VFGRLVCTLHAHDGTEETYHEGKGEESVRPSERGSNI